MKHITLGRVYKLKINNGINRKPNYMITKLWNNKYMLFWNRDPHEENSWLIYEPEKVEECLNSGLWELVEIPLDEKIGF